MTPPMDEPQTRMNLDRIDQLLSQNLLHNDISRKEAISILTELRAARTRSVEPTREMVERAKEFVRTHLDLVMDQEEPAMESALAALLTSVRSQAIEETRKVVIDALSPACAVCVGIGDESDKRSNHERIMCDAIDDALAAIRSLDQKVPNV